MGRKRGGFDPYVNYKKKPASPPPEPTGPTPEERHESLVNDVNDIFQGKFDKVPADYEIASSLDGVDSTHLIPQEAGNVAYLLVNYRTKDDKPRQATLTLTDRGFIGFKADLPRELKHLDENDVLAEIVTKAEQMGYREDFFLDPVNVKIFPPDRGEPRIPIEPKQPRLEDLFKPERVEFLRNQGALFAFPIMTQGLRGYSVYVFPTYLLCESPTVGNAAYFIDLETPVDPAVATMSKDERRLVAESYQELLDRTKTQQIAAGAQKVVHNPKSWKKKMQEAIDKRK